VAKETAEISDIDIVDPDLWVDGIPHEAFATLRREAPVFRHPGHGEEMPQWFWALTRHEDVQAANRDNQTFSSARGGVFLDVMQSMEDRAAFQTIIDTDEPEHTRLRRLVNRGFTPRAITNFEASYREAVREVVSRALELGSFDFVAEVATLLPAYAISELLGVPVEERARISELTNVISGRSDPEFSGDPDASLLAATELYGYATVLAEQRRAEPRDDIVTKLITQVDDDALGAHEFEMFILALAVAGNETTRTAMSQGMLALINEPEQMALLRRDDTDLWNTAADEIIRFATPVVYFRRTATRDVELHGQLIRENDPVALYYLSANYDDTVFTDPQRFDVTRSPNPHVSFGGGGPHYCLGAHLARLEIRVMLEELFAATQRIELAGTPQRLRSSWLNGLKRLPVTIAS
jgi:cholest-4-en-3-one 26-monooxygenase